MKRIIFLQSLLYCLLSQTSEALASPLEAEFEVDPTAYVLDGHSLHLGLAKGRYRVDLGAFAMQLPSALHKSAPLDLSFSGFGLKFDVFANEER